MFKHRALYFITPTAASAAEAKLLVPLVERAIEGGVGVVQWRQKPKFQQPTPKWTTNQQLVADVLQGIRAVTRKYQVPLIINDSLDLALQVDADGVHVGQTDESIETLKHQAARMNRQSEIQIGVTVRNPIQAMRAIENGAAYLGVGPVFFSPTKPEANDGKTIGIEGLSAVTKVAAQYQVPVYAVGGISLDEDRVQQCIRDGKASGVAVIGAISGFADPRQAASNICEKIQEIHKNKFAG